MPIFALDENLIFPPVKLAEPDGLLAVGGDLSSERLLLAYSSGIFPWYNEGDPILWWSPFPRCILDPADLVISRSLRKCLRKEPFQITFDQSFPAVVKACAQGRMDAEGTWITSAIMEAYCRLHEQGYAHSVECWQGDRLVGGLYGVAMGRCFFGESMFFTVSNASKVALVHLTRRLARLGFSLLDCQVSSSHLMSLGAREIGRKAFMDRLQQGGLQPSTCPPKSPFPGDESSFVSELPGQKTAQLYGK